MTDVDPARPIPPAEQPARLAALEAAVRARTDIVPTVGIVLGSGLGGLADDLVDAVSIPFADLPGWPAATAPGHVGRLLLGQLDGVPVAMLQGRLHMYEGNDAGLVVQPVLLMGRLGARLVVLTNAAGGLDPGFGPGTLMIIDDHINLTGRTPLLGPNADDVGPRFTDLTEVWSPRLRARLREAFSAEGVAYPRGHLRRPARADVRDPRRGPDAPVARRRRGRHVDGARGDRRPVGRASRCAACRWSRTPEPGYTGQPLTHEEVLVSGAEAGPRLARVLRRFVAGCSTGRIRDPTSST